MLKNYSSLAGSVTHGSPTMHAQGPRVYSGHQQKSIFFFPPANLKKFSPIKMELLREQPGFMVKKAKLQHNKSVFP